MGCLFTLVSMFLFLAPFTPWARPAMWKTLQKFPSMLKGMSLRETTDTIAVEVVVEMIDKGKCPPGHTQGTYNLARATSWLTIAFLSYVIVMAVFSLILMVMAFGS